MRLLVWHWGRRGAGPIFAARLSGALAELPQTSSVLSLAAGAELLAGTAPPRCDWREPTYGSVAGYVLQRLASVLFQRRTLKKLQEIKPDFAICAMPALLDRRMIRALRRCGIPYAVIVHDAKAHPGDGMRFRLLDQHYLWRKAAALFALSAHVQTDLHRQGYGAKGQRITLLWHPPLHFAEMKPAFCHGGRPRLLCFGRLLPYKGLDLLADALAGFGSPLPFEVKICGDGPVLAELQRLRALGAEVDRRWIPEAELPGLIEWADAVVLPYREASQSGVAAAALGQGRLVVATRVGGLPEQLAGQPGAILCEPTAPAIAEALKQVSPALRAAVPEAQAAPLPPEATDADWRRLAAAMRAALSTSR